MAREEKSGCTNLERWRKLSDFPDYQVSDRGRVRSFKRWRDGRKERILSPREHFHNGYLTSLTVVLFKDHRRHVKTIGSLVLQAFKGPCPEGYESCHRDGDPTNNRFSNLHWGTHTANLSEMIKHGRSTAILLPGDIGRARDLKRQGFTYPQILLWLDPGVGRVALVRAVTELRYGE